MVAYSSDQGELLACSSQSEFDSQVRSASLQSSKGGAYCRARENGTRILREATQVKDTAKLSSHRCFRARSGLGDEVVSKHTPVARSSASPKQHTSHGSLLVPYLMPQ